jgi:hypothetical protein
VGADAGGAVVALALGLLAAGSLLILVGGRRREGESGPR